MRSWARVVIRITLALLILATFINGVMFYVEIYRGHLITLCPIPFSWLVCGVLIAIARSTFRPAEGVRFRVAVVTAFFAAIGFPLAQMACFGNSDYARPADVIVVFGARTYADGQPSEALADRVRAGCDLYLRGLAPRILFSGGPGDGAIDEVHAMRQLALQLGVPDSAIQLDPQGLNTAATVHNTPMFGASALPRVLAVSHFYHLPRVKLTYEQAGIEVYTVPAHQRRTLSRLPVLMAREVAALWVYYARGIA